MSEQEKKNAAELLDAIKELSAEQLQYLKGYAAGCNDSKQKGEKNEAPLQSN